VEKGGGDMMINIKLLPCPFCGGEANLDELTPTPYNDQHSTYYSVGCINCGIGFYENTEDEAIAAWNRRTGKDINVATNADRIRGMSDEELAQFLGDEPPYFATYKQYIDWLRKPIESEVEHDG